MCGWSCATEFERANLRYAASAEQVCLTAGARWGQNCGAAHAGAGALARPAHCLPRHRPDNVLVMYEPIGATIARRRYTAPGAQSDFATSTRIQRHSLRACETGRFWPATVAVRLDKRRNHRKEITGCNCVRHMGLHGSRTHSYNRSGSEPAETGAECKRHEWSIPERSGKYGKPTSTKAPANNVSTCIDAFRATSTSASRCNSLSWGKGGEKRQVRGKGTMLLPVWDEDKNLLEAAEKNNLIRLRPSTSCEGCNTKT